MGNDEYSWSLGYGLEMDILEAPDSNDFVVEWGGVYMGASGEICTSVTVFQRRGNMKGASCSPGPTAVN